MSRSGVTVQEIDALCTECSSLIENHDKIQLLSMVHYNLGKTLADVENIAALPAEAAEAEHMLKDDYQLIQASIDAPKSSLGIATLLHSPALRDKASVNASNFGTPTLVHGAAALRCRCTAYGAHELADSALRPPPPSKTDVTVCRRTSAWRRWRGRARWRSRRWSASRPSIATSCATSASTSTGCARAGVACKHRHRGHATSAAACVSLPAAFALLLAANHPSDKGKDHQQYLKTSSLSKDEVSHRT